MDLLPIGIKSLNFVNKKTKYFVQKLNTKDSHSLINSIQQCEKASSSDLNFDQINKEQLKKVAMQVQFLGYDKDYCMIFAIYGPKIDKNNKSLLIFTLRRIIYESFYLQTKFKGQAKGFKKYCTEGITLIFFNNCSAKKRPKLPFSSKDIFEPMKIDDFKQEVIRELEIKHLVKVNEVFLVYPSLLTKSWNYLTSFGLESGFFDTYFTYSESIYDLVIDLGPLFESHRIDSSVIAYDSSVTKKNWRIVYSESQKAHSFNELASYEKMCELSSIDNLENSLQFQYKKCFKEYKIDEKNDIPIILTILMEYILENHLRFQGIFRKVAEEKELIRFQNFMLRLQQRIAFGEIKKDQFYAQFNEKITKFEVETITSFFKKLFIQLQQPIISEEVYQKIIAITIPQIESCEINFASKSQNLSQAFQIINEGKSNSKITVPKNMTASLSVNQQFQVQGYVRQKIAFFEKLKLQPNSRENKICKSVVPQENPLIQTKITFKKVPHGKKFNFTNQAKQQKNDIFGFWQMKKQYPLDYKVFTSTINLLRKIKKEQKHNFMSSNNLAICFNPCFFRKPDRFRMSMKVSIEQECHINTKLVKVLQKLIQSEDFPSY